MAIRCFHLVTSVFQRDLRTHLTGIIEESPYSRVLRRSMGTKLAFCPYDCSNRVLWNEGGEMQRYRMDDIPGVPDTSPIFVGSVTRKAMVTDQNPGLLRANLVTFHSVSYTHL